jgi:carotenoid cleavage dioxygenase-like enzyme
MQNILAMVIFFHQFSLSARYQIIIQLQLDAHPTSIGRPSNFNWMPIQLSLDLHPTFFGLTSNIN